MDARSGFRVRQIVDLKESDYLEILPVLDLGPAGGLIDPRLREGRDRELLRRHRRANATAYGPGGILSGTDYRDSAAAWRQDDQRAVRDESPLPFTERERQILEALRSSRERNEAREQQRPMSINYFEDSQALLGDSFGLGSDLTGHGGLDGRERGPHRLGSRAVSGDNPSHLFYDQMRSRLGEETFRSSGYHQILVDGLE